MVNNLTAGSPRIDDTPFFTKSAFFKLYLFSIIILNHALNYEVYGLRDMEGAAAAILYWLERLEFNISWLSISMYFFISGYGFMLGFELSKTLDKWKRRIWTLLIPWLLWNTIMWLFGIAVESIPLISRYLNSGFGYELSLRSWVVDGLTRPADGPLWFMTNLIIVILLSPLVHILVKNKYVGLAAIAANFAAIYFMDANRYSILMSLVFFMQAAWYARHLAQGLPPRNINTTCPMLTMTLLYEQTREESPACSDGSASGLSRHRPPPCHQFRHHFPRSDLLRHRPRPLGGLRRR